MKKNVASQLIGVQMITIADGTDFTGTITCEVTIDGGTKTASGGTGPTHEGEGFYTYIPTQAETNGDHLGFSFAAALAISSTVQVYTTFPQTVDNNVLAAGSTGFAAIDTVVDTINTNVGTAGAGLTNLGASGNDWNTVVPDAAGVAPTAAEINTEVDTALADFWTTPATLVDLVWDEVLTGGTHNVTNSAGKRLRQIDAGFEVHSGTAQAGTSTTITLDTGASSTDEIYDGDRCVIIGGTGAQEHGLIKSYNGTTKVATMSKAWVITPSSDSEFILSPADVDVELWNDNTVTGDGDWAAMQSDLDIVTDTDGVVLGAAGVDLIWDEVLSGGTHNVTNSSGKRLRILGGTIFTDGTAQSGGVAGTNTFRLAIGDITADDLFERAKVIITAGAGVGQEAIITSSTASTDSITITPAWTVTTDNTSEYNILPAQTHSTVRNGGYDGGYVYLDVTNGAAGTVKGVNGTTTNPSSNIADATTIAGAENIRKFKVDGGGSVTLASTYSHWLFDVVNAALLNLGSQDIGGSVFMRTGITGTGTGTDRVVFELCGMSTATVSTCNFLQCGFTGTTTLSSETSYLAWNCFENAATLPIIDMAGDGITATTLELVGYNGRIQINTLTSTDALIVTGDCHLTLDSTCTGGTITIAGDVKVTDNSSGTTIVQANLADILVDTAEIGVAGAGLGDLGGMSTAMIAEVNAAVVDVMKTDTITEMAQQAPPTNPTFEEALMYVYMALVHEGTATSTSKTFSNNAGTVIWKKTLSDDATTYTEAEGVTGP